MKEITSRRRRRCLGGGGGRDVSVIIKHIIVEEGAHVRRAAKKGRTLLERESKYCVQNLQQQIKSMIFKEI